MSDLPAIRDVRLQQIERIGPEGLARLRASRVAIVGAGNIGGAVALHVAQLGIPVTLIDRDRVGPENLATQQFAPDQVGQPKVMARVEALRRLNPDCPVTPIHAAVESLGLGVLRGVDLILAAVDSNRARIALNEIAMRLGVVWLDAAIDGSGLSYTARVAMYPGGPGGACFLCAQDTTSIQAIAGADGATTGCPTWWGRRDPVTPPTLAVSALGTAAGVAQVIWAIEFLLGRGSRLVGREAHFDFGLMAMRSHRLPAHSHCLLDHRAYHLTPIGAPVDHISVANTFRIAEDHLGSGVSLRLNRRRLVTELNCATCGEVRHPARVLEAMTEDDARCREGHLMEPLAYGLRDRLERHELGGVMGCTWGALGLPPEDVVTATRGDEEIHLLFAPSPGSPRLAPGGFHGEEGP